jgi:hypothetical protein
VLTSPRKAVILALWLLPLLARAEEPAADPLAQPPLWPVGFKIPDEIVDGWNDKKGKPSPKADVLVWAPPEAKHLRAVFMFANNSDLFKIGEHKRIREIAAKHEIGIVYLQQFSGKAVEFNDAPDRDKIAKDFDTILGLAAEKTGLAEFRHAPWITMGKSSRGRFPFRMSWLFPERVIASISYHGEVPTWPMPAWSKAGQAESILHVNVQGLSEWDGTWYRHVRPSLLNYHANTDWLAHQVVIYGVDHGYYMDYYLYPNHGQRLEKNHRFTPCTEVWDYLALFLDKAMTLRVPKDVYATAEAPVTLTNLKRESGWLIHPRAPEEMLGTKWFAFRKNEQGVYQTIAWPDEPTPVYDTEQGILDPKLLVRPASEVPEAERNGYLWVADEDQARAWLNLHGLYKVGEKVLPDPKGGKK